MTQTIELKEGFTYTVELGKDKGSYHPRYANLTPAQAALYYKGLNVGNGYKKRLVQLNPSTGTRKVLCRQFS